MANAGLGRIVFGVALVLAVTIGLLSYFIVPRFEAAYANRGKFGKDITDDAQLVEAAGHPVHIVEGATTNLKISTKADLHLAEAVLKSMPKPKPAGPAHPFAEEEMWGGRSKAIPGSSATKQRSATSRP